MYKRYILCALALLAGILTRAEDINTGAQTSANTGAQDGFQIDTVKLRYETFLTWCSPEKLFLHMDRTYYAAGETIWFKGYLQNASGRFISATSNFIYVELADEEGRAVTRVKIKRTEDGFPGQIQLRDDIKSGNYTLRAYTLWQLNSSPDYFFSQKVKILGADGRAKEKQLESNSTFIDFYPEGGRYFNDQSSVIAFKAMDEHGRSKEIIGSVKDSSGESDIPVVTQHDGMGAFSLTPKPGHEYYLEIPGGKKFALPSPSMDGGSVGVRFMGNKVIIKACALSGGVYTLIARNAETMVPLATIPGNGKAYKLTLTQYFFNKGINHILLIDAKGHIISERLFYLLDDNLPSGNFTSTISGKAHGPIGGKLELNSAEGKPIDAKVSVAIVRNSFSHYIQDDNLVSFMGLSSELKGKINNPKYYFDPEINIRERAINMDLLMMIQGWRYYDIEKALDSSSGSFKLKYLKEYTQSVSGQIKRSSGKKAPEKFIFCVLIPKLHFNRIVSVDKATSYLIDSLDFPESTPFVITTTRKGIGSDFVPTWSGETFAPQYVHKSAPGTAKDTPKEQDMPLFTEVAVLDTLAAAVVTADQSDILGGGLNSRKVPSSDLETYSYQTLIQYLVMKYPNFEFNGEVMYNRLRHTTGGVAIIEDDGEYASMADDPESVRGLVKLIEDGTETPWWPYESIYLEDIEGISVSTMADSYYNAEGGLVAVKLRAGSKGANNTRESLLYIVPLGYQEPSKFYNPRYDMGDPHDSYDHRNTILWAPEVTVTNGSADLNFCDTDQRDYPYIVTVQGYTADGQPVSVQSTIGE